MKSKIELKDKVVIVTGASSGVGRETALLFARCGAKVVAVARSRERLLVLKRDVELEGGQCTVVPTDISKESEVQNLVDQTLQAFGQVDILINNAGQGYFDEVQETSVELMRQIMEVNFYGAIFAIKALLPFMIEKGNGIIINVASVAGKRAFPKMSAYCASKFALVGFSEALHHEVIDKGIRVITICPPAIDTSFFENAGYANYKEDHQHLTLLSPKQVAEEILQSTVRKKREVIISLRAQALNTLHALSPEFAEGLTKILTGKRA